MTRCRVLRSARPGGAGVVDQDVDLRPDSSDLLGQTPGALLAGQVDGEPDTCTAGRQLGHRGLDRLGLPGGHDHIGPGIDEAAGHHGTDTPCAAGHHHRLTGHGEQLARGGTSDVGGHAGAVDDAFIRLTVVHGARYRAAEAVPAGALG